MRSFKHVARASAVPDAPARGRGGPWVAGLLALAAVSFAAVLTGLAPAPGPRADVAAGTGQPGRLVRAPGRSPAVTASPTGAASPAVAVTPGAPSALARRLGEILRLRERAYARRDAAVLDTIYTADCACLRSGRAAIARLLADHAVWRGRSVSVRVERLSRVNDSLWIALAVLRRDPFRIEGEDGTLRSAEPAARQRYRFALVRTATGAWLLGHASLVEELPS